MSVKKVFLWTTPRSVSTAFERSVRNLRSSKVFHAPFADPYLRGPDRQSSRYADQPVDPQMTYESVYELLQKDYAGIELLFTKNPAILVNNRFEAFAKEGFKDFKHSFLIRDPRKVVASMYRVTTHSQLPGWIYFDPNEVGFKEIFELFKFVQENLDTSPVVIDADDLLEEPEGMMMSYCKALGLQYQEGMTTWSPGPIAADCRCHARWHEAFTKSSGFIRHEDRKHPEGAEKHQDMPQIVQDTIKKCLPYYEAMHQVRICAKDR